MDNRKLLTRPSTIILWTPQDFSNINNLAFITISFFSKFSHSLIVGHNTHNTVYILHSYAYTMSNTNTCIRLSLFTWAIIEENYTKPHLHSLFTVISMAESLCLFTSVRFLQITAHFHSYLAAKIQLETQQSNELLKINKLSSHCPEQELHQWCPLANRIVKMKRCSVQ